MAELLLARTAPTARPLVLKWIRPEQAIDGTFIATFAAEGRRAAQLRHPNIVEVHEVGREDGTHYLAMEYVHGDDARKLLARLHERRAKLPVQHILAISTAVAQALHHAHEQTDADGKPVLHLGIKPANVIITADGAVKLADFGIGRAALTEGHTDLLPAIVGYLAPEQCVGQPVDRRTDVFGLGILIYELAVGRRLFKGDNDFVTMATIVGGDIPPPTKHRGDLPKELEAVIMKALARAPEDRYQTAHELQVALDKFATKAGVRGSLTTLAGYTKRLFGVRPEPWLVEDDGAESGPASIDFDGSPKGVAVPPPEAALGQLPGFVAAADDSPVVRLRKKVSREMPTEQLNLAALKAPLPDKSAPVKIPAASSSRASKPTRAPAVPAPTPARVKPKTVQIPIVVEKPVKEDSAEITQPGQREEKTTIFAGEEATQESPTRPSLADALITPTKPVERAATPTIPDGRASKSSEEDTVPAVKSPHKPAAAKAPEPAKVAEKKPNGVNGAPRPLAALLSLSQPDANREAPKPKLPPPSRKEPEAKVEVEVDLEHHSTAVANPPPMPVVATTVARDITEHVRPLPAPGESAASASDTLTTRRGRKKWVVIGALAAAAAATIAIVIGFGGTSPSDPPPPPAANAVADETPDEPSEPSPPKPDEPAQPSELRTSSEPRTPRNSGVTTDDQPAATEESKPTEPVAVEPPPPAPEPAPEPEPEPEPEPPPPPKFVEPKDPSPPDEEIAKPSKPAKPTKKPAKPTKKPAVAQKPAPKPAKPKPKPIAAKPKPKKPPAKPAGKWDRNSLFPN